MNLMSLTARLTPALAALALAASGCHSSASNPGVRGAGAIVLSNDDSKLYVADTDNNALVIVDAKTKSVIRSIPVGQGPERAVVGVDGRVYVSNRYGRSISVVDPVAGVEVTKVTVGTEPTGLALSPDGTTLAVTNTTSNTVSIINVGQLTVTKTVNVDADPSGIAFHPNGRLYVTHARSGFVTVLDATSGVAVHSPLSLTLDVSKTAGETRVPGQSTDPVIGSNGHVYVPHVQSKQDLTPTPVGVPTGGYAGGGEPGSVTVAATGIATIDTTSGNDRVLNARGLNGVNGGFSDCIDCGASSSNGTVQGAFDAVPPAILTTLGNNALSGPAAAAIEPGGKFLYVVNKNSNNVAILSADGTTPAAGSGAIAPSVAPTSTSNGVLFLLHVGSGPKGIAIASSGDRAWVYNSFDETISELESSSSSNAIVVDDPYKIAQVPLTPEQQLGRKLFFAADDSRMTNVSSGGIACASCHPNGRDDGRTWRFTEGPRNTPTLAGRHLATTAPYHWDGVLATMDDFTHIIQDRMGGSGEGQAAQGQSPLSHTEFNALLAYLDSQHAPDNPSLNLDGTPVKGDAVARGKSVFEGKAACISCHSGSDHTDNGFHDVSTEATTFDGQQQIFPSHVNTPALHGLFFSAPYLHDGSVASLHDRVYGPNDRDAHGITSNLSEDEKSDLVEYLQTL